MHILHVSLALLLSSVALHAADAPPAATAYAPAQAIGRIGDREIQESSGLACSILHKGHFWTHNDSGDKSRLFLLGPTGETKAVVTVKASKSSDWEDMASFKLDGKAHLLVADVGNNLLKRDVVQLYLLPEPADILSSEVPLKISVKPTRTIHFRYEDGPKNCESVAVDVTGGRILLVSKENTTCSVYELPLRADGKEEVLTAKRIATLPVSTATGMSMSADGSRVMIVNYLVGHEFMRASGETWASAFGRRPVMVALPLRKQGEAVCYGADGRTLYLSSEGASQPIWEIKPAATGKD